MKGIHPAIMVDAFVLPKLLKVKERNALHTFKRYHY